MSLYQRMVCMICLMSVALFPLPVAFSGTITLQTTREEDAALAEAFAALTPTVRGTKDLNVWIDRLLHDAMASFVQRRHNRLLNERKEAYEALSLDEQSAVLKLLKLPPP